jgi:hypothetical protein
MGANLADVEEGQREILLETINPADMTPDEVQAIADSLAMIAPDYQFVVAYDEQFGAGVSWHEVIRLWVENEDVIKGGIFGVILEHVYDAMRGRFKRRSGEHRPKSIMVNDMRNGKEILSITIDSPESEPVEKEVSIRIRPIPKKHPKQDD